MNIFLRNYFLKKKITKPHTLKYYLNFNSLLPPSGNLNSYTITLLGGTNKKNFQNLVVKQSYLLLTWFVFLVKFFKKNNENTSGTPTFFVKPVKNSKFTITKAPMAHKTFSQEQYTYVIYSINTSFTVQSPEIDHFRTPSSSLLVLLRLRGIDFLPETNLFLIQRLSFHKKSEFGFFLKLS